MSFYWTKDSFYSCHNSKKRCASCTFFSFLLYHIPYNTYKLLAKHKVNNMQAMMTLYFWVALMFKLTKPNKWIFEFLNTNNLEIHVKQKSVFKTSKACSCWIYHHKLSKKLFVFVIKSQKKTQYMRSPSS